MHINFIYLFDQYHFPGFAQSRRDDIESLSYVLLYLLRRSLPWQDVALDASGMEERIRKVGAAKAATSVTELCEGYPKVRKGHGFESQSVLK